MVKISFDFDSTLSIDSVQVLAMKLIKEGHEVWIVTSRFEQCDSSNNKINNSDLFEVADEVGIKREHIFFCNMVDKYEFFKENGDFLWHLDDDDVELTLIRNTTTVFPIHRKFGNDWWNMCLDLIRILNK